MPDETGFVDNTYEFMGGPMDGQVVTLPPEKRSYTITQPLHAALAMTETGAIKLRTGIYKVKRHPTKGYVLSWIGWVVNE